MLLGDTQYEADTEQRYGDMISARQADGLITFLPRIPKIKSTGRTPLVNACEIIDNDQITTVAVDNFIAMRDAVRYLLALGHRDIAFINGRPDSPDTIDRRRGYQVALGAAGLTADPRFCAGGAYSLEAGARAADSILCYGLPVTAFACASDDLAIGAMQSIRARGLNLPADVSVIGFDDVPHARFMDPPLTTVAQPREELGREAMLMLLEILSNPAMPPRKKILPTQLIIRASTAGAATNK